ncbi:MAG: hypothetical protein EZS28_014217 [Streblomastix strix]|uniref:Uncharacterized protein n=1 Tax=Streblomastix strix TaxID=222440 RepID=A0A5J4W5P1_9EUKA|nr:MAG: hypothetical protein EZS28_014217 [Streblomastix strix]
MTYQYDDRKREEGLDDNLNDDWTKRSQMQKDPPDNHIDPDSTWAEDEFSQHYVATPQPKQPVQQTQKIQQILVQPKQQAPAQVPKKKGRKGQPPSQDDIDKYEIIQENLLHYRVRKIIYQTAKQQQQTTGPKSQQRIVSPLPKMIDTGMNKDKSGNQTYHHSTPTWKPTHRKGVKQRQQKAKRELEQLKTIQYIQQQENNHLNNTNIEIPDIQGIGRQLTNFLPSSGAQSPSLNAGLRLKEAGSISAGN